MIDPVTGWFEITQYEDKIAISFANLAETTCMSIYPTPIESTYDQESYFIGNGFRKNLIETEYGMVSKPSTLGNPMSNVVLEQIYQVLENILRIFNISTQSYFDKNYPLTSILSAAGFATLSTTTSQKVIVWDP